MPQRRLPIMADRAMSSRRPRVQIGGVWLVALATTLVLAGCSGAAPAHPTAPTGTADSATTPIATPTALSSSAALAAPSVSSNGSSAASAPTGATPGAGQPVEPNRSLTPGSTSPAVSQATIGATICVRGYTRTVRPPVSYTNDLKVRQITQYGYADTNPRDYEEDHLISLELGGAPSDPANLWPEPWTIVATDGEQAGARVKDRFENYLHAQVCAGGLTLAAAQHQIASDWFGAWIAAGRP